jgi:hypothetical protein
MQSNVHATGQEKIADFSGPAKRNFYLSVYAPRPVRSLGNGKPGCPYFAIVAAAVLVKLSLSRRLIVLGGVIR